MDKSGLAKRAKVYQHEYDYRLPLRSYSILQLDGKAFHTWTKGLERPFDKKFISAMNEAAIAVLNEISGAKFAYVQSDEINILVTDFDEEDTQAYFSNRIQKVVSVASSIASAYMSRAFPEKDLAIFDGRFFSVPEKLNVFEFFLWRQVDARKNSVRSVANHAFKHHELTDKNTQDAKDMLAAQGIFWDEFPEDQKFGRLISKTKQLKTVEYVHSRTKEKIVQEVEKSIWEVKAAPLFHEDKKALNSLILDK